MKNAVNGNYTKLPKRRGVKASLVEKFLIREVGKEKHLRAICMNVT